ncbi:alpha/beta fold hydrolase [Kitasatospora acidiphila]|uniref:alpha/beta fold hydrolase n=1 Tax=Kitasatospora acidiphila TaxID=2567942 RepID=UPI003C7566FA
MSYAEVNGVNLYYTEQGSGEPLVLLHGGLGSTDMVAPLIPALAEHRRVIAVDLQGHGRTADVDRPIRYETLGDDIAALIKHLGLGRADLLGYSFGGSTALRTAIQHPELVRRLVVVSIAFARSGWYPEILEAMGGMGPESAEAMKPSPIYQTYAAVAPRPEDWPLLHTKMSDLLTQEYDWSTEVAALDVPTLVAFADADSITPAHMVEFWRLLGGGRRDAGWAAADRPVSRLAVLPGATHYDVLHAPALLPAAIAFLTA